MRQNTFVAGITTTLLAVVLVVAPFGVPNVLIAARAAKAEAIKLENYTTNEQTLHNIVASAQNTFADGREFDVYFGDTAGIYSVLKNIAGVEVKNMVQVDPLGNFVERGMIVDGSDPAAARFDLVVSDVGTALKLIQKLQLPLVDVSYTEPNALSVTFLTGGAIR